MGLDLFVAEVKADYSIGEIINPGKPLNSHKDDFGMIVDSLQKRGYLSSDRIGEGNDDDDIYSLELAEPFAFGKIVEGLVLNEDGMPLIGVLISFVDSTTGISQTFITDESGIYRFDLDGPGVFKINASKEGYSEIEITEETGERGITYVDDLTINKNPEVQFKFSVFDSNDDSPIPGVVVNLKDLETDDDMDNVTKESGDCLMTLPSNPTLNSTRSFDLKIQKEGYLTKIISFDILFDHAGVYDLNEYLKKELIQILEGVTRII